MATLHQSDTLLALRQNDFAHDDQAKLFAGEARDSRDGYLRNVLKPSASTRATYD